MQNFIEHFALEPPTLSDELACQVGRELGKPNGVLVFDPSAFAKQGKHSVGVAAVVRPTQTRRRNWNRRVSRVTSSAGTGPGGRTVVPARGVD